MLIFIGTWLEQQRRHGVGAAAALRCLSQAGVLLLQLRSCVARSTTR